MLEQEKGPQIALVGDIALQGLHITEVEKNEQRFLEISPILQGADMVFANLEVPIAAGNARNDQKKIIHAGDAQVTEKSLRQLNVGCVSLANNHIFDCKMDGLKATIDLLDKMGVLHTGAGWKQEHVEPVLINLQGLKVGFVAYVDKSTHPATEQFPEVLINYFEPERIRSEISLLKKTADKVICSIHWGRDYSHYPTTTQMEQARCLVDSGADVVMGHHPHVLQGYENYHDGHIFYSLGNLTYGDFLWDGKLRALRRKTKKGAIVMISPLSSDPLELIATKELPGNRIVHAKNNTLAWMLKIASNARRIERAGSLRRWISFKELVVDRILEFCFGYYRNPLADILSRNFCSKVGFIKRDYAERTKN